MCCTFCYFILPQANFLGKGGWYKVALVIDDKLSILSLADMKTTGWIPAGTVLFLFLGGCFIENSIE